jgi:hypothetical protein
LTARRAELSVALAAFPAALNGDSPQELQVIVRLVRRLRRALGVRAKPPRTRASSAPAE